MTQRDLASMAHGVIATGFEGEPDGAMPPFGAYVLFGRNAGSIDQVRALTDGLRARTSTGLPPPLVAIDQEGGRVSRLRADVEPMPSLMAFGAAGDIELAGRAGEQAAFDLRRAGCTLVFAPVLDLAIEPNNTVIGTRSAGSDPRRVTALCQAYARGLERGGMLPCFKHFPGHGSTEIDSHVALPRVTVDESTLAGRDLFPFAAVAATAPAIMGTHALVSAFDSALPATLSHRIGTDLLRRDLHFEGVYVTDSLEMGALDAYGGPVAAGIAALAAGADLLTISHSVDLAIELARAIERAVGDGTVPLERLGEAYERVLRLRAAASAPLAVDDIAPHPGVGREGARRGITLVRGVSRVDPLSSVVVSFTGGAIAGGAEDVTARADDGDARLSRESPVLQEIECAIDPDDRSEQALLEALAKSERRPLVLARRAHLHAGQARTISRILERYHDAAVISMLEPFDLPLFGHAQHVMAAYGDDVAGIRGLSDVLFGGSMAQGRLPVEVAL